MGKEKKKTAKKETNVKEEKVTKKEAKEVAKAKVKKVEKKKDKKKDKKENIFKRIVGFFKGVKSEWGKITWPQKQQVVAQTIVVLVIVTFLTAVVYLIDIGFKGLFQFLKLS